MSKVRAQKMLRRMASGEPVHVTSAMASVTKLARLAFVAEQFGYAYADVRQGGGPEGRGLKMLIIPDPIPQARARASQNWALYPNAGDGGAMPPLVPDAVALLKDRIVFDLTGRSSEMQKVVITVFGFTALTAGPALRFGADSTALVIVGVVWATLMALIPVMLVVNRRSRAKRVARLQAAGLTPVTEPGGRLRYMPVGRLPGHGNFFA